MEKKDWSLYKTETLDFIYKESKQLLEESFESFRSSGTKSDIALGLYIGLFSFAFSKVADSDSLEPVKPYLVLAIGMFITIVISCINLFPSTMVFAGSKPEYLLDPYYEQPDKQQEQLREILIVQLTHMDGNISKNFIAVNWRNNILKATVILSILSLMAAFLTFFLALGKVL